MTLGDEEMISITKTDNELLVVVIFYQIKEYILRTFQLFFSFRTCACSPFSCVGRQQELSKHFGCEPRPLGVPKCGPSLRDTATGSTSNNVDH